MADYSWFRLLVRAIGLVLIGFALPDLVAGVAGLPGQYSYYRENGRVLSTIEFVLMMGGYTVGSAFQFAFGLYLFLGASG